MLVSVADGAAVAAPRATGAQAIALGMLSNTLVKLALAVIFGRARFWRIVAVSLAAMAVASVGALAFLG